jgi:tetratricopeptide (TPR) repeat protein
MELTLAIITSLFTWNISAVEEDRLKQATQDIEQALAFKDEPAKSRPLFLEAVHQYELLYQSGHRNTLCLRNAGNAALLAGDWAKAIFAYRRGLRLSPNDRPMRECLAFAREQVDYPTANSPGRPPSDRWPDWIPRPSLQMLIWITLSLHVLACVLITRWWMIRRSLFLSSGVAAFLMMFGFATLAFLEWRRHEDDRQHPLVVIAENGVLLRTGNGLAYPPKMETPLNQGVEARFLFERNGWLQIELSEGMIGWVKEEYVLRDNP